MTRDEPTVLALRQAQAPNPDGLHCRTFSRSLVSVSRRGRPRPADELTRGASLENKQRVIGTVPDLPCVPDLRKT